MSDQDVTLPESRGAETTGDGTATAEHDSTQKTQTDSDKRVQATDLHIQESKKNSNKDHQIDVWFNRISRLEKQGKTDEADAMIAKLSGDKEWILDGVMTRMEMESAPKQNFEDQMNDFQSKEKYRKNMSELDGFDTANYNKVVELAKEYKQDYLSIGAKDSAATMRALEKALSKVRPEVEKLSSTRKERVAKGATTPSGLGAQGRVQYSAEDLVNLSQSEFARVAELQAKGEVEFI